MRNLRTKAVSMAAAIVLVFGSASVLPQGLIGDSTSITASAASTETSGRIGDNITWQLSNGTLTLSGTGETYSYNGGSTISPFYQRTDIRNVIISSGITGIGDRLFNACSVESVTFPSTLKKIGKCAFWKAKLTSVTVPDSVSELGIYAFTGCNELKSAVIGKGVKTIGEYTFESCRNLTSVIIPDTVTSIGDFAFFNCPISYASLPRSLKELGEYAFSNTALESITIPAGLTSIADGAFYLCKLKSIVLPDGLEKIAYRTFHECYQLESIKLPAKLRYIGSSAFSCCWCLKAVDIPSTVTEIGEDAFYSCTNLKTIYIPDSVTKIGKRAMGFNGDGKISGFKILCSKGSAAEAYAKANGIDYTFVDRIAGKDRYATAAKISSSTYSASDYVIIASGKDYADALAGVPLAKAYKAPILLTDNKTLPADTLSEIKRLGAKNVIILGGTGAVSAGVEDKLKANKLSTRRVAGRTRFETAVEISKALDKKYNETPEEIFFVYGHGFADALSVSPVAADRGAAIVYLNKCSDVDKATKSYLSGIKKTVKKAYIIGGEGVISNDMMNKAAKACGLTKATRIAGKNRYETCIKVNEAFPLRTASSRVCIATGKDFPDALAGGVLAAAKNAPIILADGAFTSVQQSYLKKRSIAFVYALGGKAVVLDKLAKRAVTIS